MVREPLSNIGRCHKECAPRPNPTLAQKPAEFFIGKYVKLGFPTSEEFRQALLANPEMPDPVNWPNKEHMWVLVEKLAEGDESSDGEELVGKVNNDPVYAVDWVDGTEIAFKRDEIEEVWTDV